METEYKVGLDKYYFLPFFPNNLMLKSKGNIAQKISTNSLRPSKIVHRGLFFKEVVCKFVSVPELKTGQKLNQFRSIYFHDIFCNHFFGNTMNDY